MPNEPTQTPDVPVLETASCLACGSKRIAYKVREDAQRAVGSYDRDKATIKALMNASKALYFQYFARIQATAHVLQASDAEGSACDEIQQAHSAAEKALL